MKKIFKILAFMINLLWATEIFAINQIILTGKDLHQPSVGSTSYSCEPQILKIIVEKDSEVISFSVMIYDRITNKLIAAYANETPKEFNFTEGKWKIVGAFGPIKGATENIPPIYVDVENLPFKGTINITNYTKLILLSDFTGQFSTDGIIDITSLMKYRDDYSFKYEIVLWSANGAVDIGRTKKKEADVNASKTKSYDWELNINSSFFEGRLPYTAYLEAILYDYNNQRIASDGDQKYPIQIVFSPSPVITSSETKMTLNINEEKTIEFTVNNTGGSTDNWYLDVSLSSGLTVTGNSEGWIKYDIGSILFQKSDKDSPSLTSKYLLYEISKKENVSNSKYTLKVKAVIGEDQWIKYRLSMNPAGIPPSNSNPDNYIRFPTSGDTDQQGWYAITIPVATKASLNITEIKLNDSVPSKVNLNENVRCSGTIAGNGAGEIQYRWVSMKKGESHIINYELQKTTMTDGIAYISQYDRFITSVCGEYEIWVEIYYQDKIISPISHKAYLVTNESDPLINPEDPISIDKVVLYDNPCDKGGDLTGKTDFDSPDNRCIKICWNPGSNKANSLWHFYLQKGFGGYKFLGLVLAGNPTEFIWNTRQDSLIDPAFKNGPDYGSAYSFRIYELSDGAPTGYYLDSGMIGFNLEGGNAMILSKPAPPKLSKGEVVIYDDILGGNNLAPAGGTGFNQDPKDWHALQIVWEFGYDLKQVKEYQLYVSINGNDPKFFGVTNMNYFWWTQTGEFRTDAGTPDFAKGPIPGNKYKFTIHLMGLDSQSKGYLESGTVVYSEQ